ncbi:hypothetical protein IEQ34_006204 [Dendrobium chrysotoxum]|uniref:Uncharacterized protein n=1 Tax=Dendrobium chrysotoxum TaxID=161865 RepID=A0AAV7HBX8_DENCH|nr:hypothetical protein IEQ34_006204 [Dendrobium chrysotoxum]
MTLSRVLEARDKTTPVHYFTLICPILLKRATFWIRGATTAVTAIGLLTRHGNTALIVQCDVKTLLLPYFVKVKDCWRNHDIHTFGLFKIHGVGGASISNICHCSAHSFYVSVNAKRYCYGRVVQFLNFDITNSRASYVSPNYGTYLLIVKQI